MGVGTVPVPWARPGSGFTLLFGAWTVEMARHLPVSTLAEQLDETDTRLWRFIAHYVDEARALLDYTGVEAIGIDETSRTPAEAWVRPHRLCSWMMHSRLEPMKDLARMIRRHWNEILAYFAHPYTNAVLEGADSVIRNVKRRARGFRNMDCFATMIYLTCGKLDLQAVTA